MLFIGNAAIMTGIGHYFGDRLKGDERRVLGIFSFVVFCILVAIFEAIFRIRNKYSMGHVKTPVTTGKEKSNMFTPKQIDEEISKGKNLVIFDNLVLDLNGYERIHPGGKFNLKQNIGRDISKFFFGGYSLVNVPKKVPHHHSQAALDIVKTLVVGVIKDQQFVQDELFTITRSYPVNDTTKTFSFTSIDNEPVTNLKLWYNDPAMIGRHFLVYSVQNPNVKRHYTICSSMHPSIEAELKMMADNVLKGEQFFFSNGVLADRDQNQLNLTLKTYRTKRGLATKIHSTVLDEEKMGKNRV